jgi:hypothetical protein
MILSITKPQLCTGFQKLYIVVSLNIKEIQACTISIEKTVDVIITRVFVSFFDRVLLDSSCSTKHVCHCMMASLKCQRLIYPWLQILGITIMFLLLWHKLSCTKCVQDAAMKISHTSTSYILFKNTNCTNWLEFCPLLHWWKNPIRNCAHE